MPLDIHGSYVPATGWPPFKASAAAALLVITGLLLSMLVFLLADGEGKEHEAALPATIGIAMLVMQGAMIAGVLIIAPWFDSDRRAVLALATAPPPAGEIVKTLALMLAVLLPFNAVVYALAPQSFVDDLKTYQELLQSPAGPLFAIAIAFGAPVSEELLFRGFLQSALARTSLGFVGAGAITNVAWTALHAGYSIAGLLEVFLIGILFLWLLWRTGSLWLPLIAHAIYNAVLSAVLVMLPPLG
jgi:hypothetical protein